jgi:hypothetical protein
MRAKHATRFASLRIFLAIIGAAIFPLTALAQDYTVGGAIKDLNGGTGLELSMDYRATCVLDDHYFLIHSTTETDCTTTANVNRCCSASIKATSSDNVSIVKCTCGIAIVGAQTDGVQVANDTQSIDVPAYSLAFHFPAQLPVASPYAVYITGQPSNPVSQCIAKNALNTIPEHDVTDVLIVCSIFRNSFDH